MLRGCKHILIIMHPCQSFVLFYRAMLYAERGDAHSMSSVCPSVSPSVRPTVTAAAFYSSTELFSEESCLSEKVSFQLRSELPATVVR